MDFNFKDSIKTALPNRLLTYRLRKSGSNSLLFTFDDGPSGRYTRRILEILKTNRIRAVFFTVGRFAREKPELLESIAEEGHIIGNHSFKHSRERRRSYRRHREDIRLCQKIITEITGTGARYYRPPMGWVGPASISAALSSGLTTVLWSAEGHEWTLNKENQPEKIAGDLLEKIKGGDIILLHDNNPKVPEVLDLILPRLKDKGYDLLNGINHL